MTGPGRALILTAVLVAFVCALPPAARADSPFRRVVAYTDGRIESDGVRCPGIGSHAEVYLNHRTGMIADLSGVYDGRRDPVFDLNYKDLVRFACRPLEPRALTLFSPPFALEVKTSANLDYGDNIMGLRLRRCGRDGGETLSNCRFLPCVSPQLGSRYVTWGEEGLVFAYLPRIRRRVLVGRAPSKLRGYGPALAVVHTCNRVFAQWGSSVYVARFKPRRGAPPVRRAGESALAR